MPLVRDVTSRLVNQGQVMVQQKGGGGGHYRRSRAHSFGAGSVQLNGPTPGH